MAHTHEVMDALEELVSTMKDAQTGERGYIITGEIRYLEPYNSATAAIDEKIQRLKRLTADNPRQQARIPPLQQRIQDELDILKRNIALAKKDLEAARRAVMTGEGKKALDAIRLQVIEMEQEEQDLLRERKRQSSSSYQVAVATGFLAALLGLRNGRSDYSSATASSSGPHAGRCRSPRTTGMVSYHARQHR